jgi:hypothetical protein
MPYKPLLPPPKKSPKMEQRERERLEIAAAWAQPYKPPGSAFSLFRKSLPRR